MAAPVLEQTADAVQKLAWVHDVLGSISTDEYARLTSGGQREAAASLARLKARVTAHELAAVAAVERSGAARRQGATSTGSLLARDFGGDRREADARVRQAKKVEATPASHRAMADGIITPRQARVIGDAIDLLPRDVEPEVRKACEAQLVDHAQRLDLPTFKRRADRVVGSFLVEPEDAEALDSAENQIVADREKRAWAKAEFWMGPADRDGAVKGGFVLPEAQAAMLKTAMDTLMAPQVDVVAPGDVRRTGARWSSGPMDEARIETTPRMLDEKPSYTRRLGWAFTHLCELLPTDSLPVTNNTGIVLTVSIDEDSLLDRLKSATLSTGERISAGEARRLACDHGILPAVMGGASLPLDLGRTKRLFTNHQRTALGLRDQGCVFPGCDRPPGWCQAHHANDRWADGGTTDLGDGVLLCPHHHRVVHADGWHVRFAGDVPELIPPTAIDPRRRPRRHDRFERDTT